MTVNPLMQWGYEHKPPEVMWSVEYFFVTIIRQIHSDKEW